MFKINQTKEKQYKIYELIDTTANSWLRVVPERGGIIVELGLLGDELLFLNKDTLFQGEANVRGGIPILFPICGQLENGEYELNNKIYKMKNHGVARNNPWEVLEAKSDGELSITLRLSSNAETKKSFPFDFEVNFKYILNEDKLIILQEYINKSEVDMPIYAGFHPYFKTSFKSIRLDTDAQTFLDYNDLQVKKYLGELNLNDKEEALVLLDAKKNNVRFTIPELGKQIFIEYGEEFRYVVVWSEQGQDFICVEPWMAKTKELNRKDELYYLSSKQSLKTMMSISVVNKPQ